MIKAIIFDLGNTLHPNWEMIDKSLKEVLEDHNFEYSEFMKVFDPEFEPYMGGFLTENALIQFFKMLDWNYDPSILNKFQDKLRRYHRDIVDRDEYKIWSFLRMIAPHYKLGIFSDNSIITKHEWNTIFKETSNDVFDFFIVSEEILLEKPDLEVFKILIDKTGYLAEEIIYVGDNPRRDAAAIKVGMNFVQVTGFRNIGSEYEKIKYPNYDGLERFIPYGLANDL